MFPLIDYRIKILIFSDISKFFRTLFRSLFRSFSPPDRVSPPPCRALSCIIARHSPTSVRKVQTALRKVLPLSYRQREGRFRTSSPDYPGNPEKPTGGYPGNDRTIQLHRLVDATESTAHFPCIDWSMQLNRPHVTFSIDWLISWHRQVNTSASTRRCLGID